MKVFTFLNEWTSLTLNDHNMWSIPTEKRIQIDSHIIGIQVDHCFVVTFNMFVSPNAHPSEIASELHTSAQLEWNAIMRDKDMFT